MDIEKFIEVVKKCDVVKFILTGCGEEAHATFELKNIIETLEKQIPKLIEYDKNDRNVCPMCNECVMTDDKYCSNCGQAIER